MSQRVAQRVVQELGNLAATNSIKEAAQDSNLERAERLRKRGQQLEQVTVPRRTQPRIRAAHEPALGALVKWEPTADLVRYCEVWKEETGIVVSIKTMSRMLVRLGLRQKNEGGRTRTE